MVFSCKYVLAGESGTILAFHSSYMLILCLVPGTHYVTHKILLDVSASQGLCPEDAKFTYNEDASLTSDRKTISLHSLGLVCVF